MPAGVVDFPFKSIVIDCPLCGELRRYLPSEVFLGRPNSLVSRAAKSGRGNDPQQNGPFDSSM